MTASYTLRAAAASAIGLPSLPDFLNETKTSYFIAMDCRLALVS
jgi:hypothetical protein